MAYYSGTAVDLEAVRSAIISACTGEGWTQHGDVLAKAGMYIRLQVISGSLRLLGGTGVDGSNNLTGAAGNFVQVAGSLTFPLGYELFLFEQEVFVVLNHSVDRYQWCAWGRSSVAGLSNSGMWFGATYGSTVSGNIAIQLTSTSTTYSPGALFWNGYSANGTRNVYINDGLSGSAWTAGNDLAGATFTINTLLSLLPNSWNSESVLLPMREYVARPSSKYSLVADVANARHLRLDNHQPGDVITLGTEQWKVFPWFRKNSSARNGGSNIDHSGTFGLAIRYEAP